jgi:hypothetical protein
MTISSSPHLCAFTKSVYLTAFPGLRGQLQIYTQDWKHQHSPSSPLKTALYAHGSDTSLIPNLVLAALPSLETLFMGLTLDDGISQIRVCTRIREVHLNNDGPNFGISLKVIAEILLLLKVASLPFTFDSDPQAHFLAAVPPRSSSLTSLFVPDSDITYSARSENLRAATICTLLSKDRSLESFIWERNDCQIELGARNVTYDPLVLSAFSQSLRIVRLSSNFPSRIRDQLSLGKVLCGLGVLEVHELAPETILKEPVWDSAVDGYSGSYGDRTPGYFSALLPASLQHLQLQADHSREDRSVLYWLNLIEDLLQDRARLAVLWSISIHLDFFNGDVCNTCGASDGACGLCEKSKISGTMKRLCKDVNIDLRIARPEGLFKGGDDFPEGEIDDPKVYASGKVR